MLRFISLFSGIGAPEAALSRMGVDYELVNFCEIDKYAVKSYCAIHGVDESKNLGDITKVKESNLPKDIDLICYGFPCTDISVAGKQQGLFTDDGSLTRSGLFFDALRIIKAVKPKIAVAENVKNLVGKAFTEEFRLVLSSLEAAGYNNYWQVLNSKHFGVPQNRERVFIVSIRKDIDNGRFTYPTPFALTKRLKDLLETNVDEKYYLSDNMVNYLYRVSESNKARGNGNVYSPSDVEGCSKTITTKEGSLVKDNFIEEPAVKQIGNCLPTKTRANPNQGRIYDPNGLSPTLNQMQGGGRQPMIATKEKYVVAQRGRPRGQRNEQQLEPRFDGVSNTLTTVLKDNLILEVDDNSANDMSLAKCIGGVGEKKSNGGQQYYQQDRVYEGDIALAHPASIPGGSYKYSVIESDNVRIRKLTPKECFRLMGFDDDSFHRAEAVVSNTQLYRQAGNSIVVDVLVHLFGQILDENGELDV